MIDFKWKNGMYTIVESESQWNEVVASMKSCGFKRISPITFSSDFTCHTLELINNAIYYLDYIDDVEADSQFIEFNTLKTLSDETSKYQSTGFTAEVSPPFWDGEGEPEVGMLVDVTFTVTYPSAPKHRVKLNYLSDYALVLEWESGIEVPQPRDEVIFHKPIIEPTPLRKLQDWYENNQEGLGVYYMLSEMLKQKLIDLDMLNKIAGE